MDLWLTSDQLVELTGFTWRRKQREWLTDNGYAFTENGVGRILVERAAALKYRERPVRQVQPNWGALRTA